MTIQKGQIVKVVGADKHSDLSGFYRVRSVRGGKANLGSIFGSHIYHKGIPTEQLIECENEWYSQWSKSETYACM
jgi:hypothetical protein